MPVSVQINVTIPKLAINSSVIRNSIEQAMKRKTGPQMKRLFEQTVVGWSRPGEFLQSGHNWTSEVAVRVYTRSSVYAYVNNGTPPHRIPKSGFKFMRFRPGYSAATSPRVLSSRKPSSFGSYVTAFSIPMHHGIKARDFDVEVAEQVYPDFIQDMQEAIGLGIKLGSK